jgi:hypothetical protein
LLVWATCAQGCRGSHGSLVVCLRERSYLSVLWVRVCRRLTEVLHNQRYDDRWTSKPDELCRPNGRTVDARGAMRLRSAKLCASAVKANFTTPLWHTLGMWLARSIDIDRLNQARIIVPPARHIDPFRPGPDRRKRHRMGELQCRDGRLCRALA